MAVAPLAMASVAIAPLAIAPHAIAPLAIASYSRGSTAGHCVRLTPPRPAAV
ncbi:hypothetical protein [Streptomyces bugieae]|uniref:Uncharacterized protein n=1 Tax=Streptomyces bugieae TaxID=3098223 RepID=A0ABU7NN26_9ACTN|nr:hypothetical protein [Streptomyces sp. DSM 41528]